MVAVVAKIRVQEGKMEEALKSMRAFLPHVAQEEGTLLYTVNRDPSDPNLMVVIERYRDQAAFQAHASSPQMAEFFGKAQSFLAAPPELMLLEEIAST